MADQESAQTWGRVDADGTVYVRTGDGERVVGSWQAGEPAAGLAHFARRYDDLVLRVRQLGERLRAGTATAQQAQASSRELRASLATAAVVGDLDALARGLDEVDGLVAQRRLESARQRTQATERRRALVTEAESLSTSTSWNTTGDRLRAIVEEWKAVGQGDRGVEDTLWQRLSAARKSFGAHRSAAFAERDREREQAKERKETLAREAEALSESTDWVETARAYRDLMTRWKAAGRAARADDDALWQRFRTAQDQFFERRSKDLATRDTEYVGNQAKKEALLARAERVDPTTDATAAQAQLRQIQEEWEGVGKVPRDAVRPLEDRLRAVEERVRDAVDVSWRRTAAASNPLVDQMRRTVVELEDRAARARARGDQRALERVERDLVGKRALLAQAEQSLRR